MDDKTWATIAVQLGVINPGLAEEFQRTKEELGLSKSLPEVLKENGLINDGDIEAVAALEPVHLNGTPQNDYQREQQEYARKIVGAGLINEEQATECLRDLVIEGQNRAMRTLLIERHYVKEEQLEALEKPPAPARPAAPPAKPAPAPAKAPAAPAKTEEIDFLPDLEDKLPPTPDFEPIEMDLQIDLDSPPPPPPEPVAPKAPPPKTAPAPVARAAAPAAAPVPASAPTAPLGTKKKMKCVKCKLTLEVITRAKAPNCPKCKIPLEDIGFSPQLKTDATYTTVRLKAVNKEEAKPAAAPAAPQGRHQCKICDTRFDAEPEPGGRLHCPKCGASFTAR